jgi:hypothetical protein
MVEPFPISPTAAEDNYLTDSETERARVDNLLGNGAVATQVAAAADGQ